MREVMSDKQTGFEQSLEGEQVFPPKIVNPRGWVLNPLWKEDMPGLDLKPDYTEIKVGPEPKVFKV